MISGATEQELEIANARAELLLEIKDKDKEIERLNNIINELEKWLEDYHNNTGLDEYETGLDDAICDTLKKIKALKGDSSNE